MSNEREELIGAMILSSLFCLSAGYYVGKRNGRRDILIGLEGALRIVHTTKEQ